MSSAESAPIPDRIYRWMPERAAARALGMTVQDMRKSVIRGSLKARVTTAGIAQVLVCLNPWVAAAENGQNIKIEPTENSAEPTAPRIASRPFANLLAGMHGREKVTWMVVLLAFFGVVSAGVHASRSMAGVGNQPGDLQTNALSGAGAQSVSEQSPIDTRPNADTALNAIEKGPDDARASHRPLPHATTAPTTQPILTMDVALPPGLQIGELIPRFDPRHRTELMAEQRSGETVDSVSATPNLRFTQVARRKFFYPTLRTEQTKWETLQSSSYLVGSDPNGWSVVLSDPTIGTGPAIPIVGFVAVVPITNPTPAVTTSLHLGSTPPDNSVSVGGGNPGTSVGVEPPQLGEGFSPTPEPGGLILLGFAAGPILLSRRRTMRRMAA